MISKVIAPAGSNANGNYPAAVGPGDQVDAEHVIAALIVEAVGATPAISWNLQGSEDGVNWVDVRYIPTGSEAVANGASAVAAPAAGVVDMKYKFGTDRQFKFYRAVVSGILNVTFRIELYVQGAGRED